MNQHFLLYRARDAINITSLQDVHFEIYRHPVGAKTLEHATAISKWKKIKKVFKNNLQLNYHKSLRSSSIHKLGIWDVWGVLTWKILIWVYKRLLYQRTLNINWLDYFIPGVYHSLL